MAHNHIVNDTDKHFVIDPVTRAITNQSEKILLIQGDHNSERFTFEIPRTVEDHDMSLCNRVEIHYCNIKGDRTATNADVYVAEDVAVEDDLLTFSWLISGNATLYDGSLSFVLKFKCIDNDGTVSYVWKTAVFKGISVGESYDNAEAVVEEYSDILAAWDARITALEQGGGIAGEDGKSAYEIAVENGFEGTETEWLESLKGENGGAAVITDKVINETVGLSFEKEGAKLTAVITYPENAGTGGDSTEPDNTGLDSIAYENLTYRDIFITNNGLSCGGFENGWGEGFVIGAGDPEITEEVYDSPTHSLKCFGTTSQQLIKSEHVLKQGDLYIAARIRVDRYVSGYVGINIQNSKYLRVNATTDGFVTHSLYYASSGGSGYCYVGTWSSANMDAYIDEAVQISMNIFNVAPNKETMDSLYENYIAILKGEVSPAVTSSMETTTREERYVLQAEKESEEISTADCVAAFIEAVNEKALSLGMNSSTFTRAAGDSSECVSTARDLLRMTVEACGYKDIAKVWGKNTKSFTTKDSNKKLITVNTTVQSSDFENYYYLFGGKTGSLGVYNLVVVGEVCGKMVAGVIMDATSSSTRFAAMKELFDIAAKVIADPDYDTTNDSVSQATSAIACIVPDNTFNYEQYPFAPLFEQAADTTTVVASVTKVITCMTMLDYIFDIHETFKILSSDEIGGSGNVVNSGDVISYEDALYAMLLPSSNEVAQAVARCVGERIVTKYSR